MRRFAFVIGAALPLALATAAQAEDVLIRIEAKRGADAARASAEGWGAQFPDVVTFPLADGWVGIALGPLPREEAAPRLEQLKQERKVPGDSFLSAAEGR
ncbi:peptidoglycan-binding protein, partial [Paracoccus sp. PXZ]